jgi:hypothetical protein
LASTTSYARPHGLLASNVAWVSIDAHLEDQLRDALIATLFFGECYVMSGLAPSRQLQTLM